MADTPMKIRLEVEGTNAERAIDQFGETLSRSIVAASQRAAEAMEQNLLRAHRRVIRRLAGLTGVGGPGAGAAGTFSPLRGAQHAGRAAGGFPAAGGTVAQLNAIHGAINALHHTVRAQGRGPGGPGGRFGGGFGGFGGFGGAGGSRFNPLGGIVNLASSIFLLERSLRTLDRSFLAPLRAGVRELAQAGDDTRRFVFSVAGPMGDLRRAWGLNAGLVRASGSSAATVEGLRDAARTIAFNPSLTGRLAFSNADQSVREVRRFDLLQRRLDLLDPQQAAVGGSAVAIRELLEGGEQNVASLRRRFGIGSRTLARQIAQEFGGDVERAMEEVRSNPTAALNALERYVDAFVPEEAAERMGRLVSTRLEKVREALRSGLSTVFESGVGDEWVGRLEGFQRDLLAHFDTPEFEQQARRVSQSIERVGRNLGGAVAGFLNKLTGRTGNADTVGGVIDLGASTLETLANLSDGLPELGARAGEGLKAIADGIGASIEHVRRLADVAENPDRLIDRGVQNLARRGGGAADGFELWVNDSWAGRALGRDAGSARLRTIKQLIDDFGYTGGRGDRERVERGLAEALRDHPMALEEWTTWTGAKSVRYADRFANPAFARRVIEQAGPRLGFLPGGTGAQRWPEWMRLPDAARGPGELESVVARVRAAADASDVPESVRALVKGEYTGPGYSAMLKAIAAATGSVEGPGEDSAIARLAMRGQSAFTRNLGTRQDPLLLSGVFDRMRLQYQDAIGRLDVALRDGDAVGSPSRDLSANLERLRALRQALPGRHAAAEGEVKDGLVELARNYGSALADAASSLAPFAARELQDRIATGATDLGDEVSEMLARAGVALQRSELSPTRGDSPGALLRRQRWLAGTVDTRLAAIEASAQFGDLRLGMGARDVDRAFVGRPGGTEVYRESIQFLNDALREQAALLDEIQAKWSQDPADPKLIESLSEATQGYAELLDKQRQAREGISVLQRSYEDFAESVRTSLEGGVSDSLYNLITGAGELEDVWTSVAKSILKSWLDVSARLAMEGLVGGFGTRDQNGAMQGVGGIIGGVASGVVGAFFADGGVVRSPVVGLIGEAGPEAVVPLTRSGKIPLRVGRDGVHAILPKGRSVPADVRAFADGGVVSPISGLGTRSANRESVSGLPPRFNDHRAAAATQGGAGSSTFGGGFKTEVFIVANAEQLVQQGWKDMRHQVAMDLAGNVLRGGVLGQAVSRRR